RCRSRARRSCWPRPRPRNYQPTGFLMTPASLSPPPPTSAARKSAYDRDGYVVVRGLYDDADVAAALAEAERLLVERRDLISTKNIRCRWQPNVLSGASCEFETFDPVVDIAPVCDRLAHDPRLLDVL